MHGRHSGALLLTLLLAACSSGGGDGGGDTGTDTGTGTTADTTAPGTPAGVTAAATSASSVNLSWLSATDDTGVVGYRIYRDGALLKTVASTTTDDVDLVTGVSYCYEVSAVDAANNESAHSDSRCATPAEVWTERVASADIVVEEIIYNGTEYLAVGDPSSSTNYVLKSADGLTWTEHRTDAQVLQLEDVVWTGSYYIAASGRSLYYVSADGIDWVTWASAADFESVRSNGTTLFAVGGPSKLGNATTRGRADLLHVDAAGIDVALARRVSMKTATAGANDQSSGSDHAAIHAVNQRNGARLRSGIRASAKTATTATAAR